MLRSLFAMCMALSFGAAQGEEPAVRLLEQYLGKEPVRDFDTDLTLLDAMAIQQHFVIALSEVSGPVIGYKAGLTSVAVQRSMGVSHPLRGVLLEKMLLPSGTVLPRGFATRPVIEGDLLVRVRSEALNEARTPQETLAALDAVIPFIEVPDLVYAAELRLTASALAAIDVGARYGIMGEPILINANPSWHERLLQFTLVLIDAEGRMVAQGTGRDLLGDPLMVVLWLRDSLNSDGIRLRPGDLLSLGSVTPPRPIVPATKYTARYTGLDPRGVAEVTLQIE